MRPLITAVAILAFWIYAADHLLDGKVHQQVAQVVR